VSSGAVASRLIAALLDNTSIAELCLKHHWISTSAHIAGSDIAQLIARNRTITDLRLNFQCLNTESLSIFWPYVVRSRTLKKLDISNNFFHKLSQDTVPVWSLAQCPLQHLDVTGCILTSDCIIETALSLQGNTALRSLELTSQLFTNHEMTRRMHQAFVSVLPSCLRLQRVTTFPSLKPYLRRNEITYLHRLQTCRQATIAILALKRRRLSAFKMVANEMIVEVARLVWNSVLDDSWGMPERRPPLKKKRVPAPKKKKE
jgi:hypothetical protein